MNISRRIIPVLVWVSLAAPYIDKHISKEPEENEDPEESEKQEPHLIKEPNE